MRTARARDDRNEGGAYYHMINRAAGMRSDRPFGDVEKEKLIALIDSLSVFYTLEIVGYCVMSNHFHLILWAPRENPTEAEALQRYQRFYPKASPPEPGSPELERIRCRMRDISDFGKQLQMRFTAWFNRTRPEPRRGRLWADRFKSVLLEGNGTHAAVWNCLAYVELNPVRANLVTDPADYRFSSWGRFCGSGKHPFQENFTRHLRRTAPLDSNLRTTATELHAAFRAKMAYAIALDRRNDHEEAAIAADEARPEPSIWLRADRRVRFWSDGVVIGSKTFVLEIYARQHGQEKAAKRRLGRGADPDGGVLYSMRRPLTGT